MAVRHDDCISRLGCACQRGLRVRQIVDGAHREDIRVGDRRIGRALLDREIIDTYGLCPVGAAARRSLCRDGFAVGDADGEAPALAAVGVRRHDEPIGRRVAGPVHRDGEAAVARSDLAREGGLSVADPALLT